MNVSCIAVSNREFSVDGADPCAHDHAFTQSAGVAETIRCGQS